MKKINPKKPPNPKTPKPQSPPKPLKDNEGSRESSGSSSHQGVNVGALIIRIGFWGLLLKVIIGNTPNPNLIIKAPYITLVWAPAPLRGPVPSRGPRICSASPEGGACDLRLLKIHIAALIGSHPYAGFIKTTLHLMNDRIAACNATVTSQGLVP